MEFDITKLDKKLLVNSLFAHASPLNLGKAEYEFRKAHNENVDGLDDLELEMALYEFNKMNCGESIRIFDYYKGKPMKLVFFKNKNGRVLVSSDSYDARNGKFRFFEALLNIFSTDEILITKKEFRHYNFHKQSKELIRPSNELKKFQTILKKCEKTKNEFGNYWKLNPISDSYQAPIIKQFYNQ